MLSESFALAYAKTANGGGIAAMKGEDFHEQPQSSGSVAKRVSVHTEEVFICKEGSDVILSPRPLDFSSYLSHGPVAYASFMEGVEDLPVQEREP